MKKNTLKKRKEDVGIFEALEHDWHDTLSTKLKHH